MFDSQYIHHQDGAYTIFGPWFPRRGDSRNLDLGGSRGQFPANWIAGGKPVEADPSVVWHIMRLARFLAA